MGNGEAAPTGDAAAATGPKSVEEVEAFWKYRQSQADKAHAAETAELQRQLAEAQRGPSAPPVDETPEQSRVRELESKLAESERARQATELRSEFPMAASILGPNIVNLPRESIAAIEAAADNGQAGGPPMIDPNMAARRGSAAAPAATPLNEKSKDELLADLRRLAPAYQEAVREGNLD
jgi:hypothetical protein